MVIDQPNRDIPDTGIIFYLSAVCPLVFKNLQKTVKKSMRKPQKVDIGGPKESKEESENSDSDSDSEESLVSWAHRL